MLTGITYEQWPSAWMTTSTYPANAYEAGAVEYLLQHWPGVYHVIPVPKDVSQPCGRAQLHVSPTHPHVVPKFHPPKAPTG